MDEDVTNAERDVRMKSHTEGATPSVLLLQSPRAEVVISGPAERSSHRYMRENDCHRRRPPDGRGHSRSISGVLSSILSGISGAKTSACHPAEVAITLHMPEVQSTILDASDFHPNPRNPEHQTRN